jgi:hypothetical protein
MPVKIKELRFDPAIGYDRLYDFAVLDFDPKSCKTIAEAAEQTYLALRKVSAAVGQDPNSEVYWHKPESKPHGYAQHCVSWEAGPFEWATAASFQITGPWGFTEPYYGFDLCFTE